MWSSFIQYWGINEINAESISKFDNSYLSFYSYLADYVIKENIKNKKVLEIGLGYGTLGNLIVQEGANYYGLDIAQNPVLMMQYRLKILGKGNMEQIQLGSSLSIPHADESFDYVYSIGCLHHTGNLQQSLSEVYRV